MNHEKITPGVKTHCNAFLPLSMGQIENITIEFDASRVININKIRDAALPIRPNAPQRTPKPEKVIQKKEQFMSWIKIALLFFLGAAIYYLFQDEFFGALNSEQQPSEKIEEIIDF